ncbi:phosphatases II [Coccomyxa subellipsoidea C-169]|uniref:protein-tyrosine-phosphatase n=1 Tax=Coccomyxa subellipsoidea (strain C-169) TaxID=574566 RepID=I0Z1Q2_COCSC|nr:phosphatases II [Coccomyxa subellipsoidea C-169]EIE24571.1 phosphatases II [Coccomyxa subellipsoidea C-169]|eukprot:XP_005649115.1 phosphatases II [Coccomyxa subellipsoidea C-169]
MEVKTITTDGFFRVFTSCPLDPKTFILDVRPQKEFVKQHDYSKNSYDVSWSPDCWWDKAVIVYGDSKLKRDHPVVAFLANDKHAKSLAIYKEGFEGFAKAYPFLCSASVKNNAVKRYPGEIVPKVLYLGDWEHAQQTERMDELNIRRVITIHNNPENMQLPSRFKHLRLQLADVDTQDVSKFFAPTYTFIEEARAANEGVLVHCGAGVSRSASLCIAYLMRRFTWPAGRAREHCKQRRSLVNPNQGFWRSLCAFEEQLGITDRSDPADTEDFHGADAPALLDEGAAGEKVAVRFLPAGQRKPADGAAAANGVSKEGKVVGSMELGLQSIADKVVFGRAPTCDVVLEHLSISRQHATLSTDTAGNLFITDLGSGHGTNVDGAWIRANEPRLLKKGATFKLAASTRDYKLLAGVLGAEHQRDDGDASQAQLGLVQL